MAIYSKLLPGSRYFELESKHKELSKQSDREGGSDFFFVQIKLTTIINTAMPTTIKVENSKDLPVGTATQLCPTS